MAAKKKAKKATKAKATPKPAPEVVVPIPAPAPVKLNPGYKPGQSGNPGGNNTRLSTLISNAIKHRLGEIPPGEVGTYADVITGYYMDAIVKEAKDGVISKAGVALFKEFGDRSEGKPRQTVEFTGDTLSKLTNEQLAHVVATGEMPPDA